jgi:hypothetical protein
MPAVAVAVLGIVDPRDLVVAAAAVQVAVLEPRELPEHLILVVAVAAVAGKVHLMQVAVPVGLV